MFGGPEFVVRYRNGHRTSYVAGVFEAALVDGALRPDGTELTELRFVSAAEADTLPLASWVPEVLRAVLGGGTPFRDARWVPPRHTRQSDGTG